MRGEINKEKEAEEKTNERKQQRLKVIEVNIQHYYYLLCTFVSSMCYYSISIEIFI